MNGRTAKKIRKIFQYDKTGTSPIMRRTYKKFKKKYSKSSEKTKHFLLNEVGKYFNSNKILN